MLSGLGTAALPGLPLTALPGKGTLQSGSAAERRLPRALPIPVTKDCFLLLPGSAQCIFVSLSDALFVAHIIHEGKYFSGPFFSAVLLLGGLDYSTRTIQPWLGMKGGSRGGVSVLCQRRKMYVGWEEGSSCILVWDLFFPMHLLSAPLTFGTIPEGRN